jgi:hypothetical protein
MQKRLFALALRCAAALLFSVALVGCASFAPSVSYTQQELEAKLAKRFPLQKKVAGVIELDLSNPKLQLIAPQSGSSGGSSGSGVGRVRLDMQMQVGTAFGKRSAKSDLAISLVPAISQARRALIANDIRIEKLVFDSGAQQSMEPLLKTINAMLADSLNDWVLYEFDKLETDAITKWFAGDIEPSGLQISGDRIRLDFAAKKK